MGKTLSLACKCKTSTANRCLSKELASKSACHFGMPKDVICLGSNMVRGGFIYQTQTVNVWHIYLHAWLICMVTVDDDTIHWVLGGLVFVILISWSTHLTRRKEATDASGTPGSSWTSSSCPISKFGKVSRSSMSPMKWSVFVDKFIIDKQELCWRGMTPWWLQPI